jgi:hypothetical protein
MATVTMWIRHAHFHDIFKNDKCFIVYGESLFSRKFMFLKKVIQYFPTGFLLCCDSFDNILYPRTAFSLEKVP